ncbi:aldehyde dehydrogenase family protein [Streptomyces sp. NRRL F-5126]|uniref:aldehyde dehydrogenase family protein n=1 Tax=Streptomyces sp. NRRL F-5126 TaxID=1463857 RepID=UPI0004C637D4|nr:aldehyde dehydrogenase family protein [Streptomyces sp. NRRL F-5126]
MSSFTELGHQYIDGEWRAGTGSWDIIDFDPYTGEKLAAITVATVKEVDAAYEAARRAQDGWARSSPYDRRRVFERAVRVIEDRAEEFAEVLTAELGGNRAKSAVELDSACEHLRAAMSMAVAADGALFPSPEAGRENRVFRRPVGVVTVLSPYNFPLATALMSVAPALALGNAVVLKPNQNSPISGGGMVAKIFEEAGLPAGLLNILITDIAEIGDALIEHPVPKVISFAGSDAVGRHVAELAARHLKRTALQLSNNAAFVVLDDVRGERLDYAVRAAVSSRFFYQGQVCMAANRILVDRSVEAEFTEKFVAAVRALKVGDPKDPGTHLGPLINAKQVDAVRTIVKQALDEGATALVHGASYGNFVEPTVLTGLPEQSPVMRQEIFGPVALLAAFDGEEDGVRMANDTPYGLTTAVHTADLERGVRVARRIGAGMVHVNSTTNLQDVTVMFGGEGLSGLGRLNGRHSVDLFSTEQWVSVREDMPEVPL